MTTYLILAAIADVATTLYGLKIGLTEANRKMFGKFPRAQSLIVAKVAFVVLALTLFPDSPGILYATIIFTALAVWNTVRIVRKLRK